MGSTFICCITGIPAKPCDAWCQPLLPTLVYLEQRCCSGRTLLPQNCSSGQFNQPEASSQR